MLAQIIQLIKYPGYVNKCPINFISLDYEYLQSTNCKINCVANASFENSVDVQ